MPPKRKGARTFPSPPQHIRQSAPAAARRRERSRGRPRPHAHTGSPSAPPRPLRADHYPLSFPSGNRGRGRGGGGAAATAPAPAPAHAATPAATPGSVFQAAAAAAPPVADAASRGTAPNLDPEAGPRDALLSAPRPSAGTRHAGPNELAGYADDGGEEGGPRRGGASVRAVVLTLLSLQLGWGLWLLPADFARLGWVPASIALVAVASLTAYSASLFPRLVAAAPGAVLFGDVGAAAAGERGRHIVYAVVYALDASRCVILHLAATQSLAHALGSPPSIPQAALGLAVALGAWSLAQVRALADMTGFLAAGTAGQLFAVGVVLRVLVANPDPKAAHTRNAMPNDPLAATIALLNLVFAYGGQFAFSEIIVAMDAPSRFAVAAGVATTIMSVAYAALGVVGYASRGAGVHEVIIFALGSGPWERAAAAAVLLQASAQYLVNLNVFVHNLLVLLARREGRVEGANDASAPPRVAGDHGAARWAAASAAVVAYSALLSTSLPFFSTLVGLLTAGTYLVTAYGARGARRGARGRGRSTGRAPLVRPAPTAPPHPPQACPASLRCACSPCPGSRPPGAGSSSGSRPPRRPAASPPRRSRSRGTWGAGPRDREGG